MRRDRPYRCAGALLGAALTVATTAYADVPRLVSYQGKLAGQGAGPVGLVVRFYDSATGPNVLFSETHSGVPLQDGVFSILLGSQSGAGVTDAALNATQVWLGLSVNGGAELTPRTRIGMVPFAAKARSSEQLVRPGTMDPFVTVAGNGQVNMEHGGLLVFDDAGHGINLTSDTIEFYEGTSEDPVYDYSSSTHTHRFWTNGTRRMVIDADGEVGVGTLTPAHRLHVESSGATVIYAEATATSGSAYGVRADIHTPFGVGVSGEAQASSGLALGVRGGSQSPDGAGVMGYNDAEEGDSIGVRGMTGSSTGFGGHFQGRGYFSGNVGIGEVNPTAKLHIGGTPGADGIMFPDGTLQTTAAGGGDSWGLAGNAGTTPGVNFLGTTDDQPLELLVDGTRALRIEPNGGTPNLVGGYKGNTVTADVAAATIGGGGSFGETNRVTDEAGAIGGGKDNQAGDGAGTTIDARYATVAGGHSNTASALRSTIGGGEDNTASGINSIVGGGANNVASDSNSTIGGGANNDASGSASAIAGGLANTASGDRSTVGGGEDNTANGYLATIPGGSLNEASGSYSFAAGQRAQANHGGSFVWSDSTTADPNFFSSTGSDQFLIKASGGVGINTNAPGAALHIGGIAGTDGLMFPDGTLQKTAAVGGGDSLWSESGSNIYYDTGNVGVGTSPDYPLHVVTNESNGVYAQGGASTYHAVRGETTNTHGVGVFGEALATSSTATGVVGHSHSKDGAGVLGYSASAEAPAIGVKGATSSTTGFGGWFEGRGYFSKNVGIGVEDPQALLHLGGAPDVDGIMFPDGTMQTTAAVGGSGDSLWSEFGSSIYYTAGKVGIGTSNPQAKLQLAGANANLLMLESGGSPYLALGDTSSIVGWLQWDSPDNQLNLYTYGHNYPIAIGPTPVGGIFVDTDTNSGNVGIGTTDPLAKLHVIGDVLLGTASTATIDLQAAETASEGARVELTQNTGTPTIVLDADHYGAATEWTHTGAVVELKQNDGTTGVYLRGRSSGGGLVQVNNGGVSRGQLGAYSSNGGYLTLKDAGGDVGIRVYADSVYGSHVGGTISLRDGNNDKLGLYANFEGSGFSRVVSDVIEIKGGADLSEQFDVNTNGASLEPGMVVAIDADNPGKLTVAASPYDRKVAGIISGAGGVRPGMLMSQHGSIADGKHPVALTGRVWTLCDASSGAITPGDLLTSSGTPGHAMKVVDHPKAQGAIIGKAMTSLEQGTGLVLVLVSLQ